MSFDNPRVLGLLLLLIVFIPIVIVRWRKGRESAALFAAAAPSKERKPLLKELRLRMLFSDVFFMLFAGFLIVALAGPRWGVRIVPDFRRGVDVVLAFDLSRSMNVLDCPPFPASVGRSGQENISRLDRGIGIARELVEGLGDVRIGTAIGRGRGVLAVPLTHDTETVLTFLYSLDSLSVTGRGTNLESLVNAAADSFQDAIPTRRVIILFSDGEELSGSFRQAVERARRAGITLSAVGLGTDEGGPVPVEAGPDAPDGFLLAADGRPVISTRHSDVLRNGADRTGGIFVSGSRNDAAQILAGYIDSLSAESRLLGHRREANPRWRIFVLAAMTCLAGMRVMGFSRRHPRPGTGKNRGILAVTLCLTLFLASSCVRTQGKLLIMEGNFFNARGFYTEAISSYLRALAFEEAVPYAEYGLASVYFALEESSAALERYRAAALALTELRGEAPELRYRIYYNIGIIFFEKGEYSEAVNAFRNALVIDGSRIDAKRNLELSLLSVTRASSPQADAGAEGAGEGREGASSSNSALFEYLRQMEMEQWRSREWTSEDDTSGPDY